MKTKKYYHRISSRIHLLKREVRFLYEKLTRGFSEADLWSLDITIAEFILPRLKSFQEGRGSFPSGLSDKEWDEILGKMIYSFEYHANEDKCCKYIPEEERKKVEEGMLLFAKYFGHLWT